MKVDRRDLLKAATALTAAFVARPAFSQVVFAPQPAAWRRFEVTTKLQLATEGRAAQAWIPLSGVNAQDWNVPVAARWTTNADDAKRVQVGPFGVDMLHLSWKPGTKVATAEITDRIQTKDRKVETGSTAKLTADEHKLYTAPTDLIPTDGIVREKALGIIGKASSDIDKTRAIYEWVVENTFRDGATRGCGIGDITSMLKTGWLGGKCADLNALFVGLTRSVGVPARDVYGLRVAPSAFGFRSLGANTDVVTRAQHCRTEVFLEGRGWTPADPADVRKVALEEPPGNRPLADDMVSAARKTLFGAWEGNWIAYNTGHDIVLPSSKGDKNGFFMYPEAEIDNVRLDCLDPDKFAYSMTSKDVTAL